MSKKFHSEKLALHYRITPQGQLLQRCKTLLMQKHYLFILQFLFLPFSIFPEVELCLFCLVAVQLTSATVFSWQLQSLLKSAACYLITTEKKYGFPTLILILNDQLLVCFFFFLLIIESPSVETCQKLGKHFFADVS